MAVSREEFGYARTVCDCAECAINCHYIPGYLLPTDVERIGAFVGYHDVIEFALTFLLASPGATVLDGGQIRQIPTLVPARRTDGACIFLDCDFTQKMARRGSKSWRGCDGNAAIYEPGRQAVEKHFLTFGRKRQQKLA